MSIAQTQIENSTTTIYTSSNNTIVTSIIFCNTINSPVTLTVYVVPDGGSVDDTSTIIKLLTIPARDTYIFDTTRLLLSNDDSVRALSDTDLAITATLTYMGV